MKPIKNIAAIALAVTTGLVMIIVGLLWMMKDYTAYIPSVVGMGTAILALEIVGLKRLTNLSALQKMRAIEWTTLVIALFIFVASILALPVVAIESTMVFTVAGVLVMLGGATVLIEAFV